MATARVLLSLTTQDNDYQRAQAVAAQTVAARTGVQLEIIYSGGDAIQQSQQILEAVQRKQDKFDVVITEPIGSGMPHVAEAAVKAGISWGVLNHEIDYAARIQRGTGISIFIVTVDQEEIGAMQGLQLTKMVPGG